MPNPERLVRADGRSEPSRSSWRFGPYLVAVLLAAPSAFGWYRSQAAAEAERKQALQHLSAVEQELLETKSDLTGCKAWLDARLAEAQIPESDKSAAPSAVTASGATARIAPVPRPAASTRETASPVDPREDLVTQSVRRSRQFHEVRGQANLFDLADAGANAGP